MNDLPATWDLRPLAEVCQPAAKMDPVTTGRASVRYVDIGSVDGSTHKLLQVPEVDSATAPSRCRQVVHSGDTVFSTVRPYLEKIAFIDSSLDNEFASTGFCVLRPTPDLEPRFLFHFASSKGLLDQVLPMQKGVSYPAVLDREVRGCTIPVPPLPEQRRIVAILEEHLTSLDASDLGVAQALRRMSALRRATLDKLFGLADRDAVPLCDYVGAVSAGRSFGSGNAPATPNEWGIIKVSAMTSGVFREMENKAVPADRVDPRFEIQPGDLLLSRANTSGYVGASVVVPGSVRARLLLSDKSLRISPKAGVDTEWLWRALQTPSARRQISDMATGTKDSMRNISQASLLRVLLPAREPQMQVRDTQAFRELDQQLTRQEALVGSLRSRSKALRSALLSAAFSGQLTGRSSDTDIIEDLADEEAS